MDVGRYTYGVGNIQEVETYSGAQLVIGSFCSIGQDIKVVLGGNHRTDWMTTYPFGHVHADTLGGKHIVGHPATNGDVVIGNDVWIGSGSTIMSGVTVGSGAVIAANSHVVKNVAPYEIVGGNPARVIKKRFSDDIIELLLKLSWWDFSVDIIKDITQDLSSRPTAELLNTLIAKYRPE